MLKGFLFSYFCFIICGKNWGFDLWFCHLILHSGWFWVGFFFNLKKNLHLRFESCKVKSKCLVLKSQLCKKKKGYGTKVWIWWKCWNLVKLSRTVDRHNKCAAADPPFFSSQEVSRSSEIGERASVRSWVRVWVHASSCVVLRPFFVVCCWCVLLVHNLWQQFGGNSWRGIGKIATTLEERSWVDSGKGRSAAGVCLWVGGIGGRGGGDLTCFGVVLFFFTCSWFSCIGDIRRSVRRIVAVLTDCETCSVIRKELGSTPKRQGNEQRTRRNFSRGNTERALGRSEWGGCCWEPGFQGTRVCVCVCYVPCVVKEEGKKGKDRTWVEETDRSPEPREKETQRKQRSKLLKAASLTPTRRPWPYNARRACRPSCAPLVRSSAKNTLKLSIPRSTLEFASLICSRSRHIYNLKNSFPMHTSNTTPPLSLPLRESWACKNHCSSNGSVIVVVVVYVCISCGPSLLLLHGVQDSTLQETANLCVQYPVNSSLQVLWTLCVLTRSSTVCHFCLGRSMLWVLEKEGGCCCWQWLWPW